MASIHLNGGSIGKTLDFINTSRYPTGSTTAGYNFISQSSYGATNMGLGMSGQNTITIPEYMYSNALPGDFALLTVTSINNYANDFTVEGGFTQISEVETYTGDNSYKRTFVYVGYKFLTESDLLNGISVPMYVYPTDTFGFSFNCFRNVDVSNPLDVSPVTNTSFGTITPPAGSSITPITQGAKVVIIGASSYDRSETFPNSPWGGGMLMPPSGWFAGNSVESVSFSGQRFASSLAVADQYNAVWQSGSGAVNIGNFSFMDWSGSPVTQTYATAATIKLALRPTYSSSISTFTTTSRNSGVWNITAAYDKKISGVY